MKHITITLSVMVVMGLILTGCFGNRAEESAAPSHSAGVATHTPGDDSLQGGGAGGTNDGNNDGRPDGAYHSSNPSTGGNGNGTMDNNPSTSGNGMLDDMGNAIGDMAQGTGDAIGDAARGAGNAIRDTGNAMDNGLNGSSRTTPQTK